MDASMHVASASVGQARTNQSARVGRHTRSSRIALAVSLLIVLGIASMPWWGDAGLMRRTVELSCYLALAQMWNLMAGYAGLVSVGQQAFLGVTAYAMFVLANRFEIDPFVAVAIALAVPAALAVPTYALLHRLQGAYFAIGTWVVAEAFRLCTSAVEYVGAGAGMTLRAMSKYSMEQRQIGTMWLCAAMLVLAVGGSYWLLHSRYGLALASIRDNPNAAASQGVHVKRLRFLVYLAAAVGSGLVGAVYYLAQLRITPASAYDPNWASICIFIVMVGGIGSIEGVVIGAMLYFAADRIFGEYGATYMVVLGLLTVLVALFARRGLWGLWSDRVDAPWFPVRRRLIE